MSDLHKKRGWTMPIAAVFGGFLTCFFKIHVKIDAFFAKKDMYTIKIFVRRAQFHDLLLQSEKYFCIIIPPKKFRRIYL